eukprot:GEMP01007006.1.p1 GENE.GEMP01007006.1~~GEMP01007006.1.p1  ORF type:complete len:440 (+),score=124.97 GEMP01007006.1:203-1522(+)
MSSANAVTARYLSGDEVVLPPLSTVLHARVHLAAPPLFVSRVRLLDPDTEAQLLDDDAPPPLLLVFILPDDKDNSVDETGLVAHALCGDTAGTLRALQVLDSASSGRALISLVTNKNNDNADMVALFLDAAADVNAPDSTGRTSLTLAATNGHVAIVNSLLRAMAHVNMVSEGAWSALHGACSGGHAECVSRLLAAQADVHQTNCYGEQACALACRNGHIDVVNVLLNGKANANYSSPTVGNGVGHQYPPLYCACSSGHTRIVQLLLDNSADVNFAHLTQSYAQARQKRRNGGDFALYAACKDGHVDIVFLLLRAQADATYSSSDCSTSLHAAANGGHENIARLLLDHMSENNGNPVTLINARDWVGETALMQACASHFVEVVRTLVKYKADVMCTDEFGDTALKIAERAKHDEIVTILESGKKEAKRRRSRSNRCNIQ